MLVFFCAGMVTPNQVAERVITFLERLNSDFHFLTAYDAADIRAQAAAATERYAAGKSLSVFDGVPYVVKDCLDALPYETSCGTSFMGKL
jgi:Asp-tRNA(Asn)/Glu-tRNA(Gln) amidotransferase A subunit family amidase